MLILFLFFPQIFAIHNCNHINFTNVVSNHIHGYIDTGHHALNYQSLVTTMENLFISGTELGASFSLSVNGCIVSHLWGGNRTDDGQPWEEDTLAQTYSAAKGLLSEALIVLYDQGRLNFTKKVSHYWSNYAKNMKGITKMEDLTSMKGCIPALDTILHVNDTLDFDLVDKAIEDTFPYSLCVIGVTGMYHIIDYGWIINAIVRRTDVHTRDIEQYIRDMILSKIHDVNTEIHVTPNSTLNHRIALVTNETTREYFNTLKNTICLVPSTIQCRGITNPPEMSNPFNVNNETVRKQYTPAASFYTTAVTLAAVNGQFAYPNAAIANNIIQHASSIDYCTEEVWRGIDEFILSETSYCRNGQTRPSLSSPFSNNYRAVGRDGTGGQGSFFDPDYGFGFAYLTRNLYAPNPMDNVNTKAMINAVYNLF